MSYSLSSVTRYVASFWTSELSKTDHTFSKQGGRCQLETTQQSTTRALNQMISDRLPGCTLCKATLEDQGRNQTSYIHFQTGLFGNRYVDVKHEDLSYVANNLKLEGPNLPTSTSHASNRTSWGKGIAACVLGGLLISAGRSNPVSDAIVMMKGTLGQAAFKTALVLQVSAITSMNIQATTFSTPIESSCVQGLLGGTVASLATQNPLPLLIGLSECLPKTFAQQKVGSKFLMNTYTADTQFHPSAASLSNGNFVSIWVSNGQDGSSFGIFGQLFNGNSDKIGSEFPVNTYTNSSQNYPSVAALNNNNFIVVWVSYDRAASGRGVRGQLFYESTQKMGNEFFITNPLALGVGPHVASFVNGNFVVVWSVQDIFGQLFDRLGNEIGNELQINTYTDQSQVSPSVATFDNNNFVATWTSSNQDGDRAGVIGQLFDYRGNKIGNEFIVNTNTIDNQGGSSVATLVSGNFVATWVSWNQDGDRTGVFGQSFDGTGQKIGNEFPVNTYITGDQNAPFVTGLNYGGFVVTWFDGGQAWIYGQLFSSAGSKIGNNFPVNSMSLGMESLSSGPTLQNGDFLVIWGGQNVYGQIFHDNLTSTTTITTTTITTETRVTEYQVASASISNSHFLYRFRSGCTKMS